jgi:hypothetical protein
MSPSATAREKARTASARAGVSPRPPRSASATISALGNVCVSPSFERPETVVPSRVTSRPEIVCAYGDADLLPDDRSDSGLEGIPGPRNPDAAVGSHDRPDHVVAAEVPLGLGDVQVEAADAARALDDVDQLFPVREVHHEHDLLVAARSQLDHPRVAVDDDRAPIRLVRDLLHAGNRPRAEVLDQRGPVERPVIRQP